jgi:hypothetical protein
METMEIKPMPEIVWKCEQLWAGQRFNPIMFHSREDAEKFVSSVLQMEPDQMFSIEEIRHVWN